MIRLFAAVALPPDIVATLVERQVGVPEARWRPPESLHLTLRFFGEIAEDVADDLDGELAAIRADAFALSLQGAGCFGEGHQVEAIWVGVAENPALARLAKACETAARRCGLKPETRRFAPHVTLAYLRRADPIAAAAWIQRNNLLATSVFPVNAFQLYSSRLGGAGANYRVERVYPLIDGVKHGD